MRNLEKFKLWHVLQGKVDKAEGVEDLERFKELFYHKIVDIRTNWCTLHWIHYSYLRYLMRVILLCYFSKKQI